MNEVVIVEALRTPMGKLGGTLKDVSAEDLAILVIGEVLDRTKLDPAKLDEVIMGQTKISADAPNIARSAALAAGVPIEVPAYTVTRACGSGLQSVFSGAQAIMSGQAEIVLVGGTESMSNAIFYLRQARFGYKSGDGALVDSNTESQYRSQPQDMFGVFNMGITAENIAEKYKISRKEQDVFSLQSQNRALAAIADGKFKDEIVPVVVKQRKGDPIIFDTDEFPRNTTLEKMAKLKPVFKEGGTVTAGSSSGRNDGASALLIMSAERAEKEGLKPLAKIKAQAAAGVDPRYMGMGPVAATRKALKNADMTIDQIELIELNEAFAAQSLGCIKELGLDTDIVNVNGGAIALGHPLGCSGARILTTLIHEMKRRELTYGLATICIAGGLGLAAVIEMDDNL
jgi:acetyl-CoA C-acetyltransferase